jgi:uncharacterized membrane protein
MSKLRWTLKQLSRQIWFPVTVYGLIGLFGALIARLIGPYLPKSASSLVEAQAVDSLLNILANSMLTVTTFSLSIMTAAYAFASSSATPRAFRLLQADRTAQRVLATFLGAFIFSLVGIIALEAGYYNGRGRLVLLVLTVGVLALIVTNLIRWIEQLTRFGQMDDTMDRVETAAADSLRQRLGDPYLGGRPGQGVPEGSVPVLAGRVGHIRHIDMAALADALKGHPTTLSLAVLPGSLVYPASPLAYAADMPADPETVAKIRKAINAAIVIGPQRDFDQDPRHGLIVLAQMQSLTRVLSVWPSSTPADSGLHYPAISVPPLQVDDCLKDAFGAIGRESAGMVEVTSRLMESLQGLTQTDPAVFGAASAALAKEVNARAQIALSLDADKDQIAALAESVRSAADPAPNPLRTRSPGALRSRTDCPRPRISNGSGSGTDSRAAGSSPTECRPRGRYDAS